MAREDERCARGMGAGGAAMAFLAAAMVLAVPASAAAADEAEKPRADAAQIAKLVKQLGDDNYGVREAAQEELIEIGPPARDAVAAAVESKDPEVSTRAKAILKAIAEAAARRAAEAVKKNLLWKASLPNGLNGRLRAAKGVVWCLTTANELRALDAKTGKGLWEFKTNGLPWTLSDQAVYTPDAKGNLTARNLRTGKALAEFNPQMVLGPATAAGGLIVGGGGTTLWALDGKTGKTLKEIKVSDAIDLPPVVVGKTAYFLTRDGKAHAVDLKAGKVLWSAQAAETVANALTVRDGRVIVLADEKLLALDAAEGKQLWRVPVRDQAAAGVLVGWVPPQKPNAVVTAQPAPLPAEAKAVYLATATGVLAIDPVKGKQLWAYKLPDAEAAPGGNRLGGNVVVMGGGGGNVQVRVVMRGWQGAQVIRLVNGVINIAALPGLALADGVIYVGDAKGLHAIDTKTRTALWTFKTPQPVSDPPVIADGVIYFATRDKTGRAGATLYALRLLTKK